MKVTELRIGNLILYGETNTVFEVSTIDADGYKVKNNEEEVWIEQWAFYGIPLTEEWLVRLGFSNVLDGSFCITIGRCSFIVWLDDGHGEPMVLFQHNIGCEFIPVAHIDIPVHRLQNIVHALTGEELTLKAVDNPKT